MKMRVGLGIALSLIITGGTHAQSSSVPVTVDNFPRAESDLYMGRSVKQGALGKFVHNRTRPRSTSRWSSA